MGERIDFKRPDGQSAPGYYAAPEKDADSAPGVVVVEEWWGVTPQIMETADRFAALGYRAIVPDLFRGRTAIAGDEANHLVEGLDFKDAFSQDVRGALQHLKANGKKAGVIGYCIGGTLAMLAAMHLKEPDAAVVLYGLPPEEAGDPATIEIPLQCHYAKRDSFFTPEKVSRLEDRLQAGKVPYELFWYDADHGFCNPNPPGAAGLGHYNEQAAREAWDRTARFFEKTLR